MQCTESGGAYAAQTIARPPNETPGYGRSAVIAYELPPLDDPARLERAFVSVHVFGQTGNVGNVNAGLWAIGITDGDTLLAEHLEADAELDLPNRAVHVSAARAGALRGHARTALERSGPVPLRLLPLNQPKGGINDKRRCGHGVSRPTGRG